MTPVGVVLSVNEGVELRQSTENQRTQCDTGSGSTSKNVGVPSSRKFCIKTKIMPDKRA